MKYIDNKKLIPNMWYIDADGNKVLYLGKATRTNGCWNYCECYIYLKESVCKKITPDFLGVPAAGLLIKAAQKGCFYCASIKPRKFVSEIGLHNGSQITGIVDAFSVTFHFKEEEK